MKPSIWVLCIFNITIWTLSATIGLYAMVFTFGWPITAAVYVSALLVGGLQALAARRLSCSSGA